MVRVVYRRDVLGEMRHASVVEAQEYRRHVHLEPAHVVIFQPAQVRDTAEAIDQHVELVERQIARLRRARRALQPLGVAPFGVASVEGIAGEGMHEGQGLIPVYCELGLTRALYVRRDKAREPEPARDVSTCRSASDRLGNPVL